MKLNAVGVSSSDFKKTVEFYTILGFEFPEFKDGEDHIETHTSGTRLMIDSKSVLTKLIHEEPRPGNTSAFAVEYDTPEEVNKVAAKIKRAGFTVVDEPWDAFWGQRYAVVADPDGYKVDLYASL